MKITSESLHKIAHLARLEIKPEEEATLIQSLESVLTWMEQLNTLDTSGIEPLTHMTEEVNNWREDLPANTLSREAALANAPSQDGTYLAVPKVIE